MDKAKYIIEKTKEYQKTQRIDELNDKEINNSTILITKDSINLHMNMNHPHF